MSTESKDVFRHNPTAVHPLLPAPAVLIREISDHYINSFNREHLQIWADERSNGSASHVYSIGLVTCPEDKHSLSGGDVQVSADGKLKEEICVIKFQMGPVQEVGFNGLTDEALLAIVIDRIQGFQRGPFSCRENALAVTNLEQAMHWLEHRSRDRERRQVEGTSKA